jgi:hypothetical protein
MKKLVRCVIRDVRAMYRYPDPEGSASADLYVENIQIGRLANVHFGE